MHEKAAEGLGVTAFELPTHQPAFHPWSTPRETVWALLCGREALPWEHGAAGQAEKVTQLQVLKRAVLEWHTRRTTRDTASDL